MSCGRAGSAARTVLLIAALMLLAGRIPAPYAAAAELNFWTVGYTPELIHWISETYIPQFESAHPGVTVNMTHNSWSDNTAKFLTTVAAGVPPDIVGTGPGAPFEWGAVHGYLMPLNRFFEAWEEFDQVPPAVISLTSWNGQTYSIAHRMDLRYVQYRKDLFAEAGMDPEAPPQSWEELKEATQRLMKFEGADIVRTGFAVPSSGPGVMQFFIGLLTENGGSVLSADLRRPLLLSPESVEAMAFYKELYETAFPPGYAARGLSVLSGGVGMQMGGFDHYMHVYRNFPELVDQIGYFAPRRSPAHRPAVQAFANGLAIPSGAKEPELAWKFIAGLISRDASPYTAAAGAMGPLIDLEWVMQEHPALSPVYAGLDYVFPHPLLPAGTFQRMSDALAPGVVGQVDPGSALRSAEQDLLNHLPDWQLPKALVPLE